MNLEQGGGSDKTAGKSARFAREKKINVVAFSLHFHLQLHNRVEALNRTSSDCLSISVNSRLHFYCTATGCRFSTSSIEYLCEKYSSEAEKISSVPIRRLNWTLHVVRSECRGLFEIKSRFESQEAIDQGLCLSLKKTTAANFLLKISPRCRSNFTRFSGENISYQSPTSGNHCNKEPIVLLWNVICVKWRVRLSYDDAMRTNKLNNCRSDLWDNYQKRLRAAS